jgi:hypothetical protein
MREYGRGESEIGVGAGAAGITVSRAVIVESLPNWIVRPRPRVRECSWSSAKAA